MRRVARIALLVCLAFQVVAAELPFAPPDYGIAPGRRDDIALATDGVDYFAMWREEHRGLVGARFTHGGELLDPAGILLAPTAYRSDVIWTGKHYLVVWQTRGYYIETRARTVSATGELGPPVFIGNSFDGSEPSLATNGNTVAIATGSDVYIVDLDGRVVRVARAARFAPPLVRVVHAGNEYVVLHGSGERENYDLFITTVTETRDSEARLIAKGVASAAIASDGASTLIVWRDKSGVRALPAGAAESRAVADVPANADYTLTARGGEYLLGYGTWGRTQYLQRLSREGAPLGTAIHLTFGMGLGLPLRVVTRPDGTTALLWHDISTVHAAPQNAWPFNIHRPVAISRSARGHSSVELACTSRGVLGAWVEEEGAVSFLRLGYRGGRTITVAPQAGWIYIGELLVSDDTIWLVWTHSTVRSDPEKHLLVQRFTLDLEPAGSLIPLVTARNVYDLTAAAGADGIAIAWGRGNGMGLDVMTAVIPNHVDVPTGPRVIAQGGFDIRPSIAAAGSAYVLVWQNTWNGSWSLLAQPFDGSGKLSALPTVLSTRPPRGENLLRGVGGPNGAAFVWIESVNDQSHVRGSVYRAETATPVRTIATSRAVYAIAATATGFTLLHDDEGATVLEELSADLTSLGRKTIAGARLKAIPGDVAVCGGETVVAYTRPVAGPPFGGVMRAFYSAPGSGKARSVRQ